MIGAYPFVDGSLNGVINDFRSKSLLNVHVEAFIYPQHENYHGGLCIDGNPESFCHTQSTTTEKNI